MGSNFRRLIKECKGKKLEDSKGVGGKRRLTNGRIDATQNFYICTIHDNIGDASKISAEVLAIFGHYSSTIEKPLPNDCSKGPKSILWIQWVHT